MKHPKHIKKHWGNIPIFSSTCLEQDLENTMKEKKENLHVITYKGHDAVGEVVSEITIPNDRLNEYFDYMFDGYTDLKSEIIRWEMGGSKKIHKLKL